jgi:hypothetical protein
MINQEMLAEIAAVAEDCEFPCSKQDIMACADIKNVPDEVVDTLDSLPDKEYLSETDIIESIPGGSRSM